MGSVKNENQHRDLKCDNPEPLSNLECDYCDNFINESISKDSHQVIVDSDVPVNCDRLRHGTSEASRPFKEQRCTIHETLEKEKLRIDNCELTIETDNRVTDDDNQLVNEKVCTSGCHEVLTTSPGQGFGDLPQSSQDVNQRSSLELSEKTTPAPEAPTPIREGSIVYPITGKYKNKECRVLCTRNEEFWVYPVNKQPGTPSVMYQVHELNTQPAQVTEIHQPEQQQQINLFSYDLAEDEYLHSVDD